MLSAWHNRRFFRCVLLPDRRDEAGNRPAQKSRYALLDCGGTGSGLPRVRDRIPGLLLITS